MTRIVLVSLVLMAALSATASSCRPFIGPSPIPGGAGGSVATGGGPSVAGSAGTAGAPTGTACQRAQWVLEALGCPEARTPAGTPFAAACERAALDGRDLHPACIATITACAQVEAAYRGTKCQ